MLSQDQMAFAINKIYPDLKYGQDFWTAHPVASGSAKQLAEAKIIAWRPKDIAQPSLDALRDTFAQHKTEWQAIEARRRRIVWPESPDEGNANPRTSRESR